MALPPGYLPRLAVAAKPSKRTVRWALPACISCLLTAASQLTWPHGVSLLLLRLLTTRQPDSTGGNRCNHLAAAPSRLPCRFLVYELPPGSSGAAAAGRPHPPQLVAQAEVPDSATAVHGMGWVGAQLAVCCGTRYLLVAPFGPARGAGTDGSAQWRELFSVPPELAYWPAMLATMSDVAQALLVVVSGCVGPDSLQRGRQAGRAQAFTAEKPQGTVWHGSGCAGCGSV